MKDKDLFDKYFKLSQAYVNHYNDVERYSFILGLLQGVYGEIKSESIKYTSKTKKVAEGAENRLKIIHTAITNFDYLINENLRQRNLNNLLANESVKLKSEIERLSKEIESLKYFKDAT